MDPRELEIVLLGTVMIGGLELWCKAQLGPVICTLGQSEERNIAIGTIGSALLAVLLTSVVHYLIPLAGRLPFVGRAAIVLVMLAPIGLAMGLPFASVVRYLGVRYERLVPWAWGINGLSSVIASVAAIMAAMRFGFSPVILTGAALYLGSFVMFLLHEAAARGHAKVVTDTLSPRAAET